GGFPARRPQGWPRAVVRPALRSTFPPRLRLLNRAAPLSKTQFAPPVEANQPHTARTGWLNAPSQEWRYRLRVTDRAVSIFSINWQRSGLTRSLHRRGRGSIAAPRDQAPSPFSD